MSKYEEIKERIRQELEALTPLLGEEPSIPTCPMCNGLGLVRYDLPLGHPGWGKIYPCPAPDCTARQKMEEARSESLLRRSGLGEKYRSMSFESWVKLPSDLRRGKEQALAAAWAWATQAGSPYSMRQALATFGLPGGDEDQRSWLVLHGPLGYGKTGLAAAIVGYVVGQGLPIRFYRAQEMFADIQGRYGKEGVSADDVINAISGSARLIIDEANISSTNDKQRIMEEIIRYRHGRDLPTVITCNVDIKGFAAIWGERTADVVAEVAHWVTLGGQKIRKGIENG